MGMYEIRVKGYLDQRWSDWFDGLTITHQDGYTVLRGSLVDEAALHGVLIKIRDLGLPLLSLTRVEMGREHESNPCVPREEEGRGG